MLSESYLHIYTDNGPGAYAAYDGGFPCKRTCSYGGRLSEYTVYYDVPATMTISLRISYLMYNPGGDSANT